jgi:hypothetical protein
MSVRKAFLVYERGWTGRVSPRIIYDGVQTAIDPGLSRPVGEVVELTGDALVLANSDDPQRVKRLAEQFPPKG